MSSSSTERVVEVFRGKELLPTGSTGQVSLQARSSDGVT